MINKTYIRTDIKFVKVDINKKNLIVIFVNMHKVKNYVVKTLKNVLKIKKK